MMPEKIKILLIEDEAITALLLKRNLELSGYKVFEPFATGEEAVAFIKNHPIDVALIDIRLAGKMDGIETAQEISTYCNSPIIFMTGYIDNEMKARVQVLQPVAYLVKPVTPDDIIPIIDALFNNPPPS
jgi:two-component system, response regulator PdtaR